jgi:hypothetical protein
MLMPIMTIHMTKSFMKAPSLLQFDESPNIVYGIDRPILLLNPGISFVSEADSIPWNLSPKGRQEFFNR